MSNLGALFLFVLIPPTVWWLYGPRRLAAAAWATLAFCVPIAFGALGGIIVGMVRIGTKAEMSLLAVAFVASTLSGVFVAYSMRVRRGQELGAEEDEAAVPKTEIEPVWIPARERRLRFCMKCGFQTGPASWSRNGPEAGDACPRCGASAFVRWSPTVAAGAEFRIPRKPRSRRRESSTHTERVDWRRLKH
jgi:hypothetical protein